MELIPAIDIRGGRCVRLDQGDYGRESVFDADPVAAARRWEQLGAPRLHVVDLDGAREGRPVNQAIVARIAATVQIPVQTSGGIRTAATARVHIDSGVARVIVGTAAVEDRDLVQEMVKSFGDRLVVGIDARDGVVMTRGWLNSSNTDAFVLAAELRLLGVQRFIYTDIARDGMLQGPNLLAVSAFIRRAGVPVIAAGGVGSVDDLLQLHAAGAEAAIVGMALYTGDVDLPEALVALRAASRPAAAHPSHA
ncbi:MAG: 1-(5-phosphoribosyl)-5-[(5-phosphoribosylamino)methylideneamino]imidazole-4-carboxamide isomerase [Dehalococcoidia bacterium]